MFTVRETGYDDVVFRRVDGDDGAVFVKSETLASMFVFDPERLKSRIGTGSFDIRGYTLPESRIEAFTGLDDEVSRHTPVELGSLKCDPCARKMRNMKL